MVTGAAVVGGVLFLANIHNNAAADYYGQLLTLNESIGPQGPSMFQEIEAFAIMSDINAELAGNVFTWYLTWDMWRSGHDLP